MNEVELEEELKKLNIREDFGEDSDLTPTNSPVPAIPLQNSCLPHSSNTSGFFDGDFTRFSSYEDSALLSGSSLSWGEDEFEGEATRTVAALFDQLDELIYRDTSKREVKFINIRTRKCSERPTQKIKSVPQQKKKEQDTEIVISESLTPGETSEDESLDTERLSAINIPPAPSSTLIAECKDWIDNFPHLRVIGVGIDLSRYEEIESRLLPLEDESESEEEENYSEELLESNGDYESKLQFRVLKAEVSKEKKKDKGKVPSRICSGSSDPEVLKEHVLINVFENIWPRLCQIVEPLFTKYAEWLEAQNAQYHSSKSINVVSENRGTEFPDISTLKEFKKHGEISSSSFSYSLPSVIRPPLSRPSSGMYRLPEKVPMQSNNSKIRGRPNQIIEYYVNPIHLSEENIASRSLSASKNRESPLSALSGTTSLPYLVSSRPTSRPLSSISGNRHHLLTPMPTVDQRPQSTSSSGRLRQREKVKIDQNKIVEEINSQLEETDSSSQPWSRHAPFLPQINVESKLQQPMTTSKRS